MTATTVTHSADVLGRMAPAALHHLWESRRDALAWDALVAACQPPAFDRDSLGQSLSGYPGLRSAGQSFASVSRYGYEGTTRVIRPGRLAAGQGLGTANGRSFSVAVSPGMVRIVTVDEARKELARARVADARAKVADAAAAFLLADGEIPERVPSRVILDWSAKSRVNMLRRFASIDWSGLASEDCPLGMLTLTYPRDWLAVAPTGRDAKRHLAALRQRFGRAFGRRLDGGWKLEFQRARLQGGSEGQEAPHFHLLVPVPATGPDGVESFEAWLSRTWADIVARSVPRFLRVAYRKSSEYLDHVQHGTSVDFAPTAAMSDPKRVAVYFLKHGTKAHDGKEYQHNVPAAWLVDPSSGELLPDAGPGRFWGFWGLDAVTAAVEIDPADFTAASRILRKVANARARATAFSRAKHDLDAAMPFVVAGLSQPRTRAAMVAKYRRARSFNGRNGGFVVVNDGPRLAADLGRALVLLRS